MTSWLIIIIGALVSWHYTDLESSSAFSNTFCPIGFAVFLILGVMKLAGLSSSGSSSGTGSGGGFFGGGGFGGDGGCGGGDGGC